MAATELEVITTKVHEQTSRTVDLYWENVTFTVPHAEKVEVDAHSPTLSGQQHHSGESRRLLDGCTGRALGGRVLAIMGPSGAGKTTLLNAICGRLRVERGQNFEGCAFLNDIVFSNKYKKILSFVAQDDIVFENDSPREALYFSYRIRSGKGKEEADVRVKAMLERLGLTKCADTPIGTAGLVRGVSGGERKRTNIGVELINDPRILLLDEPTTGLDSVTAVRVVTLLKELAQSGCTVICTIHTPSSELFALFDDILLMANGGVVYHGPVTEAPKYFADAGYAVPKHYNPSDHYMKLLQMPVGEVIDLTTRWKAHVSTEAAATNLSVQSPKFRGVDETYLDPLLEEFRTAVGATAGVQLALLLHRSYRNFVRNKIATFARLAQTIFMAILLGLFFFNLGNEPSSVQDRMGFLFMMIINSMFLAIMNGVAVFPPERSVFLLEQANDAYNAWIYFLSKIIAEIPFQIGFPILYVAIVYFMVGLVKSAEAFFICVTIVLAVSNTSHSFGLMLAAFFPDPKTALAIVPLLLLPFTLSGGFMANTTRLEPYWTWLNHISFARYGFTAVALNEFDRLDSLCPPNTTQKCVFQTGHDVIKYYGFDQYHWGIQVMALCIMMVGLRFLTGLSLWSQGRRQRARVLFTRPNALSPLHAPKM